MSYICLFASENGVAAAGDSRECFQSARRGLHRDWARKVFSDETQGLVWACCGLKRFRGVNSHRVAAKILRDRNASLADRLERIASAIGPLTEEYRLRYKGDGIFILLVGRMADGKRLHIVNEKPDVRSLCIVNGKATVRRHSVPALLEGGWHRSMYPPHPGEAAFAREGPEQLSRRAARRVEEVIALDHARRSRDRNWIQTVGGSVRCVYTKRK